MARRICQSPGTLDAIFFGFASASETRSRRRRDIRCSKRMKRDWPVSPMRRHRFMRDLDY